MKTLMKLITFEVKCKGIPGGPFSFVVAAPKVLAGSHRSGSSFRPRFACYRSAVPGLSLRRRRARLLSRHTLPHFLPNSCPPLSSSLGVTLTVRKRSPPSAFSVDLRLLNYGLASCFSAHQPHLPVRHIGLSSVTTPAAVSLCPVLRHTRGECPLFSQLSSAVNTASSTHGCQPVAGVAPPCQIPRPHWPLLVTSCGPRNQTTQCCPTCQAHTGRISLHTLSTPLVPDLCRPTKARGAGARPRPHSRSQEQWCGHF